MPTPRSVPTAFYLKEEDPMVGRFLVIGGRRGIESLKTVEMLEKKRDWLV